MKRWMLFAMVAILALAVGFVAGFNAGAAAGDQAAWQDTAHALDHFCNSTCCTIRATGSESGMRMIINSSEITVIGGGGQWVSV